MFSGAFVRFLVLILAFKKENTCTDSLIFNEFSGGPQMGLCEQSIIQKWRA